MTSNWKFPLEKMSSKNFRKKEVFESIEEGFKICIAEDKTCMLI